MGEPADDLTASERSLLRAFRDFGTRQVGPLSIGPPTLEIEGIGRASRFMPGLLARGLVEFWADGRYALTAAGATAVRDARIMTNLTPDQSRILAVAAETDIIWRTGTWRRADTGDWIGLGHGRPMAMLERRRLLALVVRTAEDKAAGIMDRYRITDAGRAEHEGRKAAWL